MRNPYYSHQAPCYGQNGAIRDQKRLRQRMVREQIAGRGIKEPAILRAMATVPRHLFVPEALRSHAYEDSSLPIGHGQTISQPFSVARMCSLLELEPGMRVLEIGLGSGYQAAVLAAMGCIVYGIERIREIYQKTGSRLRQLELRGIHVHRGDGTLGLPQAAPFDRILVSAGGPEIPAPLKAQLAEEGIMVMPVGEKQREQRLLLLRKEQGRIACEDKGPAIFVDLIGDYGWRANATGRSNKCGVM